MDNLMATSLQSMIHEQFVRWNEQEDIVEEITSALTRNCTNEDTREEVFSRMIFNSMEIAAGISAKVILEILLTAGVIKPVDEDQLRKNVLSIVK